MTSRLIPTLILLAALPFLAAWAAAKTVLMTALGVLCTILSIWGGEPPKGPTWKS